VKILQRLKNGCVIVVSLLNTVHVVPSFFNLSLGVYPMRTPLLSLRTLWLCAALFFVGLSGLSAQMLPKPQITAVRDVYNPNNGYYNLAIDWTMTGDMPVPDIIRLHARSERNGVVKWYQAKFVNQSPVPGTTKYSAVFLINLSEGNYDLFLRAQYGLTQNDSARSYLNESQSFSHTVNVGYTGTTVEFTSPIDVVTTMRPNSHRVTVRFSTNNGNTWTNGLPSGAYIQEDFTGNPQSYLSSFTFDQKTGLFTYTPSKPGRFQGVFSVRNEQGFPIGQAALHVVNFLVLDCPGQAAGFFGTVKDENGNNIKDGYVLAFGDRSSNNGQDSGVFVSKIVDGFYYLPVQSDNYRLFCSAYGYESEYHDDVKDYKLATPISLQCGDSAIVNFVLDAVSVPKTYRVIGQVGDNSGQLFKPIEFAFVSFINVSRTGVNSGQTFSAITGITGVYNIELPEGDYIVHCTQGRNGMGSTVCYLNQYYKETNDRTQATVLSLRGNAQALDTISFNLTPCNQQENNRVVGIVTNSTGTPIASSVIAFRLPTTNEGIAGITVRSADAPDGNFNFEKLKPGTYLFFAFPTGVAAVPGFYKLNDFATLEWQKATLVTVSETSTSQIAIKLNDLRSLFGKAGIRGWVRKNGPSIKNDNVQGAEPMNGAIAYAVDAQGIVRDFALSNAEGLFEMSTLTKGTYTLHIERVGYTPSISQVTVEGDEKMTEVSQTLSPAISVSVDEETVAQTGNSIVPNPAQTSATVHFTAEQGTNVRISIYDAVGGMVAEYSMTAVDGANSFALNTSELTAGAYYIQVHTSAKTLTLPCMIVR
jgi:hypothetical protein